MIRSAHRFARSHRIAPFLLEIRFVPLFDFCGDGRNIVCGGKIRNGKKNVEKNKCEINRNHGNESTASPELCMYYAAVAAQNIICRTTTKLEKNLSYLSDAKMKIEIENYFHHVMLCLVGTWKSHVAGTIDAM